MTLTSGKPSNRPLRPASPRCRGGASSLLSLGLPSSSGGLSAWLSLGAERPVWPRSLPARR